MTDLEKAANIVARSLIGEFPDNLKPMAKWQTTQLGYFLTDVLNGMPLQEAINKCKEGEQYE